MVFRQWTVQGKKKQKTIRKKISGTVTQQILQCNCQVLVLCIKLQVWRARGYTTACHTVPLLQASTTSPREKSSLTELALNQKLKAKLFTLFFVCIFCMFRTRNIDHIGYSGQRYLKKDRETREMLWLSLSLVFISLWAGMASNPVQV